MLDTRVPLLEGSAETGEVTVLVRPESMQVTPSADGNGRIVAVSFRGSICMFRVRLFTDALVHVQMPSAEATQFTQGTSVQVTMRPVPVLAVPVRRDQSEPEPSDGSDSRP